MACKFGEVNSDSQFPCCDLAALSPPTFDLSQYKLAVAILQINLNALPVRGIFNRALNTKLYQSATDRDGVSVRTVSFYS